MNLRDLGLRIRAQREKRGLKQQDVANALGISPQAVSKWERGENAPDIAVLSPLARLLGVSADWLLDDATDRKDVFEATVLASSVHGAYERSLHMEPRDFAAWANGLFYTLTETTQRYGGVPIKYMGDQFLCFFSGHDHAARAIQTALRAKRIIAEDLKIGLSTGQVYLGSVGHPDYARPDIMGEVVNIAFLTLGWAESETQSGIAAMQAVLDAAGTTTITTVRSKKVSFRGIERPVAVCEIDLATQSRKSFATKTQRNKGAK
ncbi:MAG TPA: helix-turn-helix domain-containing protein [Candidatus Hydrogenedentes bacterium]|nr:helix-turn-helix domain-containing protein [Candidatus Hydrogenedentota bacterium]HOS03655.1 helix-turn-helix domain-containing protein [Candidatus Hydrogenedentota bacterium]